jgi:hypothetical protein
VKGKENSNKKSGEHKVIINSWNKIPIKLSNKLGFTKCG